MKNKKKIKNSVIVTTAFVLGIILITSSFTSIATISPSSSKLIEKIRKSETIIDLTYNFKTPFIDASEDYDYVFIEGLNSFGQPGEPVIPVKTAKILLPPASTVEKIEIVTDKKSYVSGSYFLAPGQEPVPLSKISDSIEPTMPNPKIYGSDGPYPGVFYEVISIQRVRGFSILILNLFPLQYIPKTGEVLYYPELDVNLVLMEESVLSVGRRECRMLAEDMDHVQSMVDNPEVMTTYSRRSPIVCEGDGERVVDPPETFAYVVITSEELLSGEVEFTFQDLVQSKIDKGLSATIVTVEEIVSCPDYWWNGLFGDGDPLYNDTQCHIRNFIKDAYLNWGTEYILLGGDGDGADVGGESGDNIIPVRKLYTDLDSNLIASDLYYSCLDGSYDSNGNGIFGEEGDGFDIDPETGEIDLIAEVYVGRAPVDTLEELSNFVRKTLAYEGDDWYHYIKNALMVGEYLRWEIALFGADFKDEIKNGGNYSGYITAGIPDSYEVFTLYDRDCPGFDIMYYCGDTGWLKSEVLSYINSGVHIINHLGHGDNFKVMKLHEPIDIRTPPIKECHDVLDGLTNDQYFFGYSQACYAGSFDNILPIEFGGNYSEYDAIVETLVGAPHGAFAFIGNTRYGFIPISQHFDRQFFDALFGEDIRNLGRANQDSKEDNIGMIGGVYGAYIRFCYYEITLFGDPEISIKDPVLPDHDLCVSTINASDVFLSGNGTYINATIVNQGLNDETDIMVNLVIDGILVDSCPVMLLGTGQKTEVSYYWSNETISLHDILVEVEPVPGEEFVKNNEKNRDIAVASPQWILVNDEYNETTPGWNIYCFNDIQNGIDAASENDFVLVCNGNYNISNTIIIDKKLQLAGMNKQYTIVDNDGGKGIYLSADEIHLSGLTIQQHSTIDPGDDSMSGIYVNSHNNTITKNIVKYYYDGIHLNNSYHNIISRNFVTQTRCGSGIHLSHSSWNVISENIIKENSKGIYTEYSSNNSFQANTIFNNDIGIFLLLESSHNIVFRNTITKNWNANVIVGYGSHNNRIVENIISENIYAGASWVYGLAFYESSNENLIYRNNFINNSQHAYDECNNVWYNETLQEGNYWDDFENNPGYPNYYEILPDGSNKDLYPLTTPWSPLIGDINGDGIVNVLDLLLLLADWGKTDSPADLNSDGIVNVTDLLILLANWS